MQRYFSYSQSVSGGIRRRVATIAVAAALAAGFNTVASAQPKEGAAKAPENWFTTSFSTTHAYGMRVDEAYDKLLKGKKGKKVVVAVLDSGVEIDHEDLKDHIWTNPKEIPNNGIDDDHNGYVDDVHGWNFLGGKGGKNIDHETLEATRVYREGKAKFDGKDEKTIEKSDREAFKNWSKAKEEYEGQVKEAQGSLDIIKPRMEQIGVVLEKYKKKFGTDVVSKDIVDKIADDDADFGKSKKMLSRIADMGGADAMMKQLKRGLDHYQNSLKYNLNVDYDPRKDIIGDDQNNMDDHNYGNNDYEGPDASHGTHVSGMIAADRDNKIGIRGVCANCVIMSVRCVPDGDERDKDIANAIRYAVDNGAEVINMSFGKAIPHNKKAVDDAVKYAEKKGVLLVHAAGNESQDKDGELNYPNRYVNNNRKKEFKNWLDIGAMSWHSDEKLPANFSNYGTKTVDVFAPGVDILSTVIDGKYDTFSGTSMASPATAGACGLLLSYYPDLTPEQVREIIMKSAKPIDMKVLKPGTQDKVDFKTLSITGGVVDFYAACELADKTKGKRKGVKRGADMPKP